MKLKFNEIKFVQEITKEISTPFYLCYDSKEKYNYSHYLKIDEKTITSIDIYITGENDISYTYEITENDMSHENIWKKFNGKRRITEKEFNEVKLLMLEFIKNN